MKTLFHSKKLNLHIWMSGSLKDPYSNIYISGRKPFMFNYGGKDHFYDHAKKYRGLNIFPTIWKRYKHDEQGHICKEYKVLTLSNNLYPWLQKCCMFIHEVNNRKSNYWPAPDETPEPIPSWVAYAFLVLRSRYKQKHCKHEFEVDSDINGDSGQEWFYCPKCGWGDHIIWY